MRALLFNILIFWVCLFCQQAIAQTCEATAERQAVKIAAIPYHDGFALGEHPEAYGTTPFYQNAGEGRIFALIPQNKGWAIRVYEAPYSGDSVDLSEITPDRGGKNPRTILPSDFTNENSSSEKDRLFFFSDSLKGTGGFRPPRGGVYVPTPEDGLGWLKILDYGLSDLEPRKSPRLTYLKFEACLTWPKTEDEKQVEADLASPIFLDTDIETFGTCGLNLAKHELSAAILPRILSGDFDGDGSHDEVTQIRRKSDGKRGLAMCRAGTYLDIIGLEEGSAGANLRLDYIRQMEAWRILKKDRDLEGYIGEENWPIGDGDILALERIEKELILLLRKDGVLQSHNAYHIVTE